MVCIYVIRVWQRGRRKIGMDIICRVSSRRRTCWVRKEELGFGRERERKRNWLWVCIVLLCVVIEWWLIGMCLCVCVWFATTGALRDIDAWHLTRGKPQRKEREHNLREFTKWHIHMCVCVCVCTEQILKLRELVFHPSHLSKASQSQTWL